jgi:xylulose-5-phosphate/fructose-6-phosphate phosphoketolase
MDNPDLIALAVVGDGEAETGPLEGSWKGISFLNPVHDGAVLPVLHLNGAKIAGPTVLARKDPAEVRSLLEGHGYEVLEVEGSDLPGMHHRVAEVMAQAYTRIRQIQEEARADRWDGSRPRWPVIVMRSPKGWTGPEEVDGIRVTGTWRSHQVPLSGVKGNPDHLALLDTWLRSYRPEELFDADGRPTELVLRANPEGTLRMSDSPPANGGDAAPLDLPDFRDYAVDVPHPAAVKHESTRALGEVMRDLYRRNPDSFRLFCPDETNSNRLGAVFEASDRGFAERLLPDDLSLSHEGRVMEVLSEHNCHGWLEVHPDRSARVLRDVRGLRHGERVADDPAQQVAQGGPASALAGTGAQPEHLADLDRMAQRPQRFLPPGSWPDPERHHPARGRGPGLLATGRELPAVGLRACAAVAFVREPRGHRQAAPAAVADL